MEFFCRFSKLQILKTCGLKFMDSHNTSVHLNNVTSARIFNITIAESSYNADGIHVSDSKDVTIDHCRIATVGDCISIVDGSFNLKISNIVCGTGGGRSVGKLGSTGNIENIVVSDVVFINTRNGAQIKTMGKVSKGHVRKINFERILLQDSRNPISINQFYCGYERCSEHKSDVQVSDITFREIFGTCKGESAMQLVCRTSLPCTGILFEDINIHSDSKEEAKSYTVNAKGVIRGQNIPEISFDNQLGY
ncbi:hypothetical protein P3S68_006627 [Capsicum galapagoense]